MTSLTSLTIAAAREGLKKKQFSALELTEAYLAAMEKARVLNAYVVETPEKAREMAKASDARLAAYRGVELIKIRGSHHRSDIALLAATNNVTTPSL